VNVRFKARCRRHADALIGIVLLCMCCAAETTWLFPNNPAGAEILAASEGIDLSR
jgi:hypothetical protein